MTMSSILGLFPIFAAQTAIPPVEDGFEALPAVAGLPGPGEFVVDRKSVV